MMRKLLIWGAGEACDEVLRNIDFEQNEVVGIVDVLGENQGKKKWGYVISAPDSFDLSSIDIIILASFSRFQEMEKRVFSFGYKGITLPAFHFLRANKKMQTVLELSITDFCNLSCSYCSQGSPVQEERKWMSFNDIKKIAEIMRPYEFSAIKISGGEPTLHLEFNKITSNLKKLFPAHKYVIATNGAKYLEYKELIDDVYNVVDLSWYPGQNDEKIREIRGKYPTVLIKEKGEDMLMNTEGMPNKEQKHLAYRCVYKKIYKIVQNRIYPCCNLFGETVRKGFPPEIVSVSIDKLWRENIKEIDLEPHCINCFVDVARI